MPELSAREFEIKELNKAFNLGIAGLVGALIPLIGLVLGVISLVIANSATAEVRVIKSKKSQVIVIATIAICLSVAAGVGYFVLYRNNELGAKALAAQQQKEKKEQKEAQETLETQVRLSLQNCLSQADESYNAYLELNSNSTTTDSNGEKIYRMPQANWDYINQKRTNDKDECYRAAENKDTSRAFDL